MSRFASLLSRRTMLRAGALAGLTVLTPNPRRAGRPEPVTASAADDLVDAFGVVIHLHFRNSVYADHGRVASWLSMLGARHVRSRLSPRPEVLEGFEQLAGLGVKVEGVCGASNDTQSMESLMDVVSSRFADPSAVFSAFEGVNEPNNDGVPWVEKTRERTVSLRRARDAHGLTAIPIVAPALARVARHGIEGADTWEQAVRLGDLSPWVNYGNIHVYPKGLPASQAIAQFTAAARMVAPDLPVICSEGGYFTAMDYVGGAFPVPPRVAAAYAPQLLLDNWIAGTRRFFRYEFFDDPGSGEAVRESSFGMVGFAGPDPFSLPFPKPDFVAMRRLLGVFTDPGPPFAPAPLHMSLSGPGDLRSALFARHDGSYLLCLWLDRPAYDPVTRRLTRALTGTAATCELRLATAHDISLESLVAPEGRTSLTGLKRVPLDLPMGVTIVTLTPS